MWRGAGTTVATRRLAAPRLVEFQDVEPAAATKAATAVQNSSEGV
jgi:hypothetical protein